MVINLSSHKAWAVPLVTSGGWLRLALLLWLAVIVAGCSGPPKLPRLAPDAVILAFGDSITHGTGARPEQSYPSVLEQLIDRKVVNAGVPGETTPEGRQRLPQALETVKPDLVILCLGGNDFLRKRPESEARANLAAMIESIQAQDISVMLLAVPKPRLIVREHAMYTALGERYDVPVVDDVLTDILSDKSLKADAIHPNAKGYAQLAEAIAQSMRETGALP